MTPVPMIAMQQMDTNAIALPVGTESTLLSRLALKSKLRFGLADLTLSILPNASLSRLSVMIDKTHLEQKEVGLAHESRRNTGRASSSKSLAPLAVPRSRGVLASQYRLRFSQPQPFPFLKGKAALQ
jgi:hypothetical protein